MHPDCRVAASNPKFYLTKKLKLLSYRRVEIAMDFNVHNGYHGSRSVGKDGFPAHSVTVFTDWSGVHERVVDQFANLQ